MIQPVQSAQNKVIPGAVFELRKELYHINLFKV